MRIVLTVIELLSAVALIATILLQSGRSAGLAGMVPGGAEQLFGKKRGLDELLRRVATILAVIFFGTTLLLALI